MAHERAYSSIDDFLDLLFRISAVEWVK